MIFQRLMRALEKSKSRTYEGQLRGRERSIIFTLHRVAKMSSLRSSHLSPEDIRRKPEQTKKSDSAKDRGQVCSQSRDPVELVQNEHEGLTSETKFGLCPLLLTQISCPPLTTLLGAPKATSTLPHPLASFWAPFSQLMH